MPSTTFNAISTLGHHFCLRAMTSPAPISLASRAQAVAQDLQSASFSGCDCDINWKGREQARWFEAGEGCSTASIARPHEYFDRTGIKALNNKRVGKTLAVLILVPSPSILACQSHTCCFRFTTLTALSKNSVASLYQTCAKEYHAIYRHTHRLKNRVIARIAS